MSSDNDISCESLAPLPPLRPEVRIEQVPGARPRIFDEAQDFRAAIDDDIAALALALDGRRTAADVAAALAARGVAVTRAQIESALGSLDGLFLLENERGRSRAAAARRERAAASPPGAAGPAAGAAAGTAAGAAPPVPEGAPSPSRRLHVLAGDRFDCHACGFCCSNGSNFGPVTRADADRILAHDWSEWVPGARGAADLFVEVFDGPVPASGEGGKLYLAQRGGRCVFLDEEGLCKVHKRLGYEAKPFICRLFPFAFARTPEGTYAFTRRECASIERSRRTGTPLERQRDALARLAEEEPDPIVAGALVPFVGTVAIPYRLASALRAAALRALEAPGRLPGGVLDRLLGVRDVVAGVSARLGERPGEAEIERALGFAEHRASLPAALPPAKVPDALAAESRLALASIASDLADLAMKTGLHLRFEAGDVGATRREGQDACSVALLELLSLLAPTLARPLAGRLPPFDAAGRRARIAFDAADGAPAAEALRDALRQEVHGWAIAARTPLLQGYALQPLRAVLAIVHARRVAEGRGAAALAPEDVHEGLLIAIRSLTGAANEEAALRSPKRLLAFYQGLRFGDPL
jgi:Fe-S-cluster containining protein